MSDINNLTCENLGLLADIEIFQSISSQGVYNEYSFEDLNEEETYYLKQIILNLENNENVILCSRGDNEKNYSKFLSQNLYDLFVVGTKSKFHYQTPLPLYYPLKQNQKFNLDTLVEKCNNVLKSIQNCNPDVKGEISPDLILWLKEQPTAVQDEFQFLLLSFLHNKDVKYCGKKDFEFKPYSCFTSLSYGNQKYEIAKKYALHENRRKGIIYIYILGKSWKNYISAEEMNLCLKRYGVEWRKELDNEIMLMNGLYPHFLIGFFLFENKKCQRFLLNPWFLNQIKEDLMTNRKYPYENGVHVNQESFVEAAKRLGYNTYFIKNNLSLKEFIVEDGKVKEMIKRNN